MQTHWAATEAGPSPDGQCPFRFLCTREGNPESGTQTDFGEAKLFLCFLAHFSCFKTSLKGHKFKVGKGVWHLQAKIFRTWLCAVIRLKCKMRLQRYVKHRGVNNAVMLTKKYCLKMGVICVGGVSVVWKC